MGWQDIAGHGRGCGIKPLWESSLQMLVPAGNHRRLCAFSIQVQAKDAAHPAQGRLGRLDITTDPGTIRDFCRQVRQHGEGSGRIEVVRHGVHERLLPNWGPTVLRARPRRIRDSRLEARCALLRLGQLRWVILPDLSVVVPGEEQAYGVRRVLRQEILDHDEVAQRFANLSARQLHHCGMEPPTREGLLVRATF